MLALVANTDIKGLFTSQCNKALDLLERMNIDLKFQNKSLLCCTNLLFWIIINPTAF